MYRPEDVTDFGRWIPEKGNGTQLLRCPDCGNVARWPSFGIAVGADGIRFCPFCGADLRRDFVRDAAFEEFIAQAKARLKTGDKNGDRGLDQALPKN